MTLIGKQTPTSQYSRIWAVQGLWGTVEVVGWRQIGYGRKRGETIARMQRGRKKRVVLYIPPADHAEHLSVQRDFRQDQREMFFFQKDVLQRHREMSLFSWILTMNTKVRRSSGWRSNLVGPKLSRSGDAPQERLSCVRLVSGAMHERRCKPVVQLANCQSSCTPDKSSQRLTRCLVAVRVCGADADISKASQFVHCDFCVLPTRGGT